MGEYGCYSSCTNVKAIEPNARARSGKELSRVEVQETCAHMSWKPFCSNMPQSSLASNEAWDQSGARGEI